MPRQPHNTEDTKELVKDIAALNDLLTLSQRESSALKQTILLLTVENHALQQDDKTLDHQQHQINDIRESWMKKNAAQAETIKTLENTVLDKNSVIEDLNIEKFHLENSRAELQGQLDQISSKKDIENSIMIKKLLSICQTYLTHLQSSSSSEQKSKIVGNLVSALNSEESNSEKLIKFKAIFSETTQNTLSKSRDSGWISFVKTIATVLSFGLAAWAGIFNVEGFFTTKKLRDVLGTSNENTSQEHTEDQPQPR